MHAFKKFKDTAEAVESLGKFMDGEMPKNLKVFLKKNIISQEIQDSLLCNKKEFLISSKIEVIRTLLKIACLNTSTDLAT